MRLLVWLGVLVAMLIGGAPLFSEAPFVDPVDDQGQIRWFLLTETKSDVRRELGQPKDITEFSSDFEAWQYQIGDFDEDDYSHQLIFRKSSGQLISVTRNYDRERPVDAWFPPPETTTYNYPDDKNPKYRVRLRRLSGGRILMAMGVSAPGQATAQIVLIRESEVRFFHSWLAEQLRQALPAP